MAAIGSTNLTKNQLIASSLCKHFSLDPKDFSDDFSENDIKTLYSKILQSSGKNPSQAHKAEVMKWIEFAESFPTDFKECFDVLTKLNEDLATLSVLLGNGLRPSEADVIVFSTIHSFVAGLPNSDCKKLPHVIKWMDYIQLPRAKGKKKKKALGDKEATQEKKRSETEAVEKVNALILKVGLICSAWKHPYADSLLVAEIDIAGYKLMQVVSDLLKYCNPDELMNRRVVVITNVGTKRLRQVKSRGLVLYASNEDHTIVEPLLAPKWAKLGETVLFSGIDGIPKDILTRKVVQLDKIAPDLFIDDNGVATFKGIPFMTSAGPCTSSVSNATIKW